MTDMEVIALPRSALKDLCTHDGERKGLAWPSDSDLDLSDGGMSGELSNVLGNNEQTLT